MEEVISELGECSVTPTATQPLVSRLHLATLSRPPDVLVPTPSVLLTTHDHFTLCFLHLVLPVKVKPAIKKRIESDIILLLPVPVCGIIIQATCDQACRAETLTSRNPSWADVSA